MANPTEQPRRWFAVLLLSSLAVAIPAIDAPYFSDDFQFVFADPALDPAHYFAWHNPHNIFYRPIQSAFLAAVQIGWGLSTWPIHSVHVVLHAALAMLVLTSLVELGFRRRDAALASLLVAVSQAAAMTVSSNDTLSQLLGVLAGYLSVRAFHASARSSCRALLYDRRYLSGLAWLAVSLFSQETSVAFVAMGAFALLAGTGGIGARGRRVRAAAARVAPLILVLVLYLAARGAAAGAGPGLGENDYGITVGPNIARNLAMLWVAATTPFSSVSMFTAVSAPDRMTLAALGVVYAAFAAIVGAGLWRRRRHGRLWRLWVLALLSVASIVPVNHVSELYAYQLLPVAAAIVAWGLGGLHDAAGRSAWIVVVAAVIASHALAAHSKATLLDENARRAATLLDPVVAHARGLARGGELVLRNPAHSPPEYSMFRMSGFNYLRHADFYIARRAGRDDISVRIAPADEPGLAPAPGRVILVLDGDRVEALPAAP
jgi:hypothetical protein